MVLYPIDVGNAKFRCGPWRGSPDVAYLVPLSPASTLGPTVLSAARAKLVAKGFSEVITGAVGASECKAMHQDGFVDREQLHLLSHDLSGPIPRRGPRGVRIGRARRSHHQSILELDSKAFDAFWRLDESGLQEALSATPISRLRVVRRDEIVGYAITGRAGRNGYLQRLAVSPDQQGAGIGSALVHDSLRWLKRNRVSRVWVNTQQTNSRAFGLYQRLGFRSEPTHLTVLQRQLI